MANIKFEIDGKIYDFAPESFAIDNDAQREFFVFH